MNRTAHLTACSLIAMAIFPATKLWAINGPGSVAINNPGAPADPYPFVPILDFDNNNNGFANYAITLPGPVATTFTEIGTCTGTLIAPNVVASAAHCLMGVPNSVPVVPQLGMNNSALPVGQVRVRFGDLNNNATPDQVGTESFTNINYIHTSGRIGTIPPVGSSPPAAGDVIFVQIGSPAATPIPILPRSPRTTDVNRAVGYGGPTNPQKRTAVLAPNGNVVNATHVSKNGGEANELFTEGGDSGGPGFVVSSSLPAKAYANGWDARGKNVFVMTAEQGGGTPGAGTTDYWTRLDANLPTLNQALNQVTNITITHNIPDNPAAANPNDVVGILMKIEYFSASEPYIFFPRLFEEDSATAGAFAFDGDVALRPTTGLDDMAGIGWGAGNLLVGQSNILYAWDFTTAGYLVNYLDEVEGPLVDWKLAVNYGAGHQSLALPADVTLAALQTAISGAQTEINNAQAIRGPFVLVPEPSSIVLLGLGLAGLYVPVRRLTWRQRLIRR